MKQDCALIGCAVSAILAVASPIHAQPDVRHVPVRSTDLAGMLATVSPDDPSSPPWFLPLRRTDGYLEVMPGVIEAAVIQEFTNDTDTPLEAVYVFPLPSRATITGVELLIGDRTIRSVVQEREAARRTYETAKQQGNKAALLEQERPNLFTTSVTHFNPGETLRVALTYLEPLTYRDGGYEIAFPMVVGPRYVPFSDPTDARPAVTDADRIRPEYLHPRVDPEHRVHLVIDVVGCPVKDILSSTHSISLEPAPDRPDTIRATLRDGLAVPHCDFAATIRLAGGERPAVSVVRSTEPDADYALITLFPPASAQTASENRPPRDVVFLIDTSGSMSGPSLEQARAGLLECLAMLRPEDRFSVVRFADDVSAVSSAPWPATPDQLVAARAYIESLVAAGGTRMQPALAQVLELPTRAEATKYIVFLTDGDVGNEHELLALLDRRLGAARLFTFGIGSAPNEYLMRRMAELGRGQSRFIRTDEDVGAVMSDFFASISAPICTDLELAWLDQATGREVEIPCFPSHCPDLFLARPLQVVARLPASFAGRVVVRGWMEDHAVDFAVSLPPGGSSHTALACLFGRGLVNELMVSWMVASGGERDRIRAQVVEAALAYQLVTRFTSRVAVEEIVSREPDGRLVTARVPVSIPRDWGLLPTAGRDPLGWLIGCGVWAGAAVLEVWRRRMVRGSS